MRYSQRVGCWCWCWCGCCFVCRGSLDSLKMSCYSGNSQLAHKDSFPIDTRHHNAIASQPRCYIYMRIAAERNSSHPSRSASRPCPLILQLPSWLELLAISPFTDITLSTSPPILISQTFPSIILRFCAFLIGFPNWLSAPIPPPPPHPDPHFSSSPLRVTVTVL